MKVQSCLVLLAASSCAGLETLVQPPSEGERTTISLEGFESVEECQETPVWCWAACAAMILRYGGREVSQREIAERIHGRDDHEVRIASASRYEIYRALCPEGPDTPFEAVWNGLRTELGDLLDPSSPEPVEAGWRYVRWNEDQLEELLFDLILPTQISIEQLSQGHPAVAGLRDRQARMGHVYVVVGATYVKSGTFVRDALESFEVSGPVVSALDPEFEIEAVELVDPLASDDPATELNERRVTLAFREFEERVEFVITRTEAMARLQRLGELVDIEQEN